MLSNGAFGMTAAPIVVNFENQKIGCVHGRRIRILRGLPFRVVSAALLPLHN